MSSFGKIRRDQQRAKHIPVAEPPDDEAAARAAIEYAFSHFADTAEDGTLVNVQDDEGLGKPLEEAGRRDPYRALAALTHTIETRGESYRLHDAKTRTRRPKSDDGLSAISPARAASSKPVDEGKTNR